MKPKEAKFIEAIERGRALKPFESSTLNKEKGTVDAVFATKERVLSYLGEIGYYWEELGFEKGMVRMERINTAAPILDRHQRYDDDLGIVAAAKLSNDNLNGTLRFDLEDERGAGKRAFGKIERGIWKTLSVGYNVYALRLLEPEGENGYPVYQAVDWEPTEVSTAPMAADINAQIRIENQRNSKTNIQIEPTMKDEKTPEQLEQERVTSEKLAKENKEKGRVEEQTRVEAIRTLATTHKMDEEFIAKHIKDNSDVEKVRVAILETIAENQPKIKHNARVVGRANEAERAEAMSQGILLRINERSYTTYIEKEEKGEIIKNNPFRSRTLMELVDDYLVEKGTNISSMSASQRVITAIKMGKRDEVGMSTSDLPNIFQNVLNKILRKEYNFQTGKWQKFCYNQPAKQINRPENSINMGDFQEMPSVKEGGEYILQSVIDSAEKFSVAKFGNKLGITLEMILNDDLAAMERMGMKAAKANLFTEDFLVWNLLQSNPNMSDGNAIFSNAHANLAPGSVLSTTSINELWLKITKQNGLNGKPLDIDPRYIVTGRNNQSLLDQILNPNLMPITPADAVQSYVRLLQPIYTNYIRDNRFYVIADPMDIDTIRYGGLIGEPDFALESWWDHDRDSYMYKMRKYFGASWTDFRGAAFNPGT